MRFRSHWSRTAAVLVAVLATVGIWAVPPSSVGAIDDVSVRWDNFSESGGCGQPFTRPPFASRIGFLSDGETVLGPFGTYFGRSVAAVRSKLVWWTVPGSGGKRVQVHQATLPAFQEVAAGLASHAAAGRVYPISTVSAFVPRTIGGSYQMSRHALGTAIDMNYQQNPYRSDGTLITNMPSWFVKVWRDAGFCWGGDWQGIKDPMHFSWIGPISGGNALAPISPATGIKALGSASVNTSTVFAPIMSRYAFSVADATGNGAPDVAGLREHPSGAVLDIASSTRGHGSCSIVRWFINSQQLLGAGQLVMTDIDGDSRVDLVGLEPGSGGMQAKVATHRGGYNDMVTRSTSIDADSTAIAGSDFNGDHKGDLWAVSPDGTLRIHGGASFTSLLHEQNLPSGAPQLIAAGDRDGGNTPELFALYPTGSGSRVEILRLGSEWQLQQSLTLATPTTEIVSIGAGDYDGDGRADLQIFDSQGRLRVHLGNTSTGQPVSRWFLEPDPDCSDPVKLVYDGRFFDDDTSVHQNGIEAIASAGITAGCNPPFNDRFCPNRTLTRAEAATFFSRALGLPSTSIDFFVDDNGHPLEGGINRLAAAGITQGCNPPQNNRFCPNRALTRAEFATFIARALGLPATTTNHFSDDDGHVLEGGINRIAEAGITTGCNPPANTHFCPDRLNTRAEAATFLTRALR